MNGSGNLIHTFDVEDVRADFPILNRKINGKDLVYLDNAATTQKPRQVINALTHYYEETNANVHRGVHTLSVEATDAYELAREKVSEFINAPRPETVIWTRNTSESLNLIAATWAEENVTKGDNIVITAMEHHSNIVPWQLLCEQTHARLRVAPIDDHGEIRVFGRPGALNPRNEILEMHGAGRGAVLRQIGAENPHLGRVRDRLHGRLAQVVIGLNPPERADFRDIDRLIGAQIVQGSHGGIDKDLERAQDFTAHVPSEDHLLDHRKRLGWSALEHRLLSDRFGDHLPGLDLGP